MWTDTIQAAPSSKWRARDAQLRAHVESACLRAGGPVDVVRLRRSFYLRHGRRYLSAATAALLICLALPAMAAIAIAIKLDSPGPVFFVQNRTGYLGRRFKLFKFRTMIVGAEALKDGLRPHNLFSSGSPDFKLADDPRVTTLGKFLRRTSLDELPNLFNVVLGHMALVGPRPTSFPIETYSPRHFPRLAITPGITGLWQVSGRANIDFDERTNLDVEYINTASIILDMKILYRTVFAVSKGHGAY